VEDRTPSSLQNYRGEENDGRRGGGSKGPI